jgi:ABC-2 type transport system permease protein
MHNVLMIMRREYLERVTKKSFWIGTAVFPLIMVAFSMLPMLLVGLGGNTQKRIALVDATGKIGDLLSHELADEKLPDGSAKWVIENVPPGDSMEATREGLRGRVRDGSLYGILVVGPDIDAKDAFEFDTKTVGDIKTIGPLQGSLRRAVIGLRLERNNVALGKEMLDKIMAPVELEPFEVGKEGGSTKKDFMAAYFGTFFFVLVLFMTLLVYGIAMMRGILEEKSSRVMEVLLGSVSPNELMSGKIFGIGLVGLTQVAIYAVTAGVMRVFVAARFAGQKDMAGILSTFTFGKLAFFLVFFLLGYFMYVALFACVGAVCNSEQEAQNLQAPITWCLMLPMMATIFFVGNPDSTASVVVSFIPIFTPMVMFMRICVQMPPMWQILLSIAITAGTTWLLFRAAAKIFRIGILMYGKRPTIPEIFRWARS